MKITNKLAPVALAAAMAAGTFAAPGIANAEMSASMGVANFYLWRGLDISAGAPQVSGSLDYSHKSGAYAGVWASSEDAGTETDLYIGFAGEMSGLSYDISFWEYLYPSDNGLTCLNSGDVPCETGLGKSDAQDLVLGLGFADVGFTYYKGTGNADYVTLDYTYENVNFLYGFWSVDGTEGSDDSHITVAYSPTDNFTFSVSMGMQDDEATTGLGDALGYDEDPLFHVSYSLPLDLK